MVSGCPSPSDVSPLDRSRSPGPQPFDDARKGSALTWAVPVGAGGGMNLLVAASTCTGRCSGSPRKRQVAATGSSVVPAGPPVNRQVPAIFSPADSTGRKTGSPVTRQPAGAIGARSTSYSDAPPSGSSKVAETSTLVPSAVGGVTLSRVVGPCRGSWPQDVRPGRTGQRTVTNPPFADTGTVSCPPAVTVDFSRTSPPGPSRSVSARQRPWPRKSSGAVVFVAGPAKMPPTTQRSPERSAITASRPGSTDGSRVSAQTVGRWS